MARAVHGWVAVQRLVAGARPLGPRENRLTTWNRLRTIGRRPVLRVSRDVRGACAVGLRRPSVLVSESLAASLDDERLEHVVLHELAHLETPEHDQGFIERLQFLAGQTGKMLADGGPPLASALRLGRADGAREGELD
jgi:hypothetical protein